MFRCNKDSNENKIILSNFEDAYDLSVDESLDFGADELQNTKMLRGYKEYKYIHVIGKTSVIMFDRENFRGNKKIILFKNLSTEKSVIQERIKNNSYVIDIDKAKKEFETSSGQIVSGELDILSIQMKKEN